MSNIFMNPKQFEEIGEFYISLGLSEKQAKRLQKNVFNYTVKADENTPYNEKWSFYPQRPERQGISALFGSVGNAMGSARKMSRSSVMADECRSAAPMMAAMGSAPACAEVEEVCEDGCPEPESEPEFNTAETHKADDLPEMDPLADTEVIFSANVNNASWSYVRNSVKRGRNIDPSFVRAEEMINGFDYDIAAPTEKTFAVSAQTAPCPWREEAELLFVGIKGAVTEDKKPNHLVFLVDVSGSMQDEVVLEQMAIMALVSKLRKGDTMSIITYSDKTKTVIRNLECGDMDKCIDAVLDIYFENGCTYGSAGLENAYELLSAYKNDDANNRVFIFTDGDFNFGISSEGGLAEFIKEKKKSGIYLSVVGYGMHNFKDNHMEALSRNGNGNYCFIGSPEDIKERLFKQFDATVYSIAKDVKIKVEMNPEYVGSYRLIGYNARKLTRQDFDDTEKAVDGFGSGQISAALIEFTRRKTEESSSSRYTVTESKKISGEFAAVTIRYKSINDENKEQLEVINAEALSDGDNAKIAAYLAAFGLEMSRSQFKGTLDKEKLGTLLESMSAEEELTQFNNVFAKYLKK